VVGVDNIEEILMLNAAGFTITDRAGAAGSLTGKAGADILKVSVQEVAAVGAVVGDQVVKNYFPNPDKKYKGRIDVLSLIKDEKKVKVNDHGANINDDGTHIFNRQGIAGATVISKTNIDNFFKVFYDATKKNKQDFRGFYFGDAFTSVGAGGNEADLTKNATRADYKGFDIFATTEVEG
jgi:hypothetical protein